MRTFGLLGRSLAHSFSARYFTEKFSKEHIKDCQYRNFETDDISTIRQLAGEAPDLQGLNVTIPYKVDVIPFLDELDREASATGAVNCIRIDRSEANVLLKGYNSDVEGFRRSLSPLLADHSMEALVLGSGGAARAVKRVLEIMGIKYLLVSGKGPITYRDLGPDLVKRSKLIINATPVGMFPSVDEKPQLPYHAVGKQHLLFDLVYNPAVTGFMKEGLKRGARVVNGYHMFVMQAEESWKIWNKT